MGRRVDKMESIWCYLLLFLLPLSCQGSSTLVGCYVGADLTYTVERSNEQSGSDFNTMTVDICVEFCRTHNAVNAFLRNGFICKCGDISIGAKNDHRCTVTCRGPSADARECGGSSTISAYRLIYTTTSSSTTTTTTTTTIPPPPPTTTTTPPPPTTTTTTSTPTQTFVTTTISTAIDTSTSTTTSTLQSTITTSASISLDTQESPTQSASSQQTTTLLSSSATTDESKGNELTTRLTTATNSSVKTSAVKPEVDGPGEPNTVLIASAAAGALILLLLVFLIVFLIRRKMKIEKDKTLINNMNSAKNNSQDEIDMNQYSDVSEETIKGNRAKGVKGNTKVHQGKGGKLVTHNNNLTSVPTDDRDNYDVVDSSSVKTAKTYDSNTKMMKHEEGTYDKFTKDKSTKVGEVYDHVKQDDGAYDEFKKGKAKVIEDNTYDRAPQVAEGNYDLFNKGKPSMTDDTYDHSPSTNRDTYDVINKGKIRTTLDDIYDHTKPGAPEGEYDDFSSNKNTRNVDDLYDHTKPGVLEGEYDDFSGNKKTRNVEDLYDHTKPGVPEGEYDDFSGNKNTSYVDDLYDHTKS